MQRSNAITVRSVGQTCRPSMNPRSLMRVLPLGRASVRPIAPKKFIQPSGRRTIKPVAYREDPNRPGLTSSSGSTTSGLGTYDTMRDTLSDVTHNRQFKVNSFGTLTLLTTLVGMATFLIPQALCTWVFGFAPTTEEIQLTRLFGSTMFTAAAVKGSLTSACREGLLSGDSPDTYRRLNLGIMLTSVATLWVLFQAESIRTAALTFIVGGLAGCSLLLAGSEYAGTKGGWPLPSIRGAFSALFSLFNPRRTSSAIYSLISIGFAGLALALSRAHDGLVPPLGFGFPLGAEGVFMCRCTAAGLVTAAVAAFTLKDASDRAALSRERYRSINFGLAATSLLQVVVFMGAVGSGTAAVGNQFWFPVIFGLVTFFFTAYQYITSVPAYV